MLRCRLTSAPSGAPEAVIVKYVPQRHGEGCLGFLNEWAGLRFLSSLEIDPPVTPTFYGGDLQEGVLVLEDLGAGDALADVLLGSDAATRGPDHHRVARSCGRIRARAQVCWPRAARLLGLANEEMPLYPAFGGPPIPPLLSSSP